MVTHVNVFDYTSNGPCTPPQSTEVICRGCLCRWCIGVTYPCCNRHSLLVHILAELESRILCFDQLDPQTLLATTPNKLLSVYVLRLTSFLNIVEPPTIFDNWGRGHYDTDEGEANDGDLHLKACEIEFLNPSNAYVFQCEVYCYGWAVFVLAHKECTKNVKEKRKLSLSQPGDELELF